MSIDSEIQALVTNVSNAYDSIQEKGGTIPANKNTENLASSIDTITSGSEDKFLWFGGKNPFKFYEENIILNLSNDTSYNSVTPSSSYVTILNNDLSNYRKIITNIDLANYDWVTFTDVNIKYNYLSIPSTNHALTYESKQLFFVSHNKNGNVENNIYYNDSLSINSYKLLFKNNGNVLLGRGNDGTYGITPVVMVPTISSTSSENITITLKCPGLRLRSGTAVMDDESWSNLDSNNTNIKIRHQIFRLEKESYLTKFIGLINDDCLRNDGNITTNDIT